MLPGIILAVKLTVPQQEYVGYQPTPEVIREWARQTESLYRRIDPLFVHPATRLHARQYLHGLLSPLEKKNSWTIGELADENPKKLQRFLNLATWDASELLAINRQYAMEHFADPEAILAADPTGFAKKGKKSAGVQRQYSGTLGRVDNCQIGTFLAYVTPRRDRVLIDGELYIPQSWTGDEARCAEAGIPAGHAFATRPAQVITMIERARQAGVPFSWFTADEEFGQNPSLRDYLEENEIAYVMSIPKNTPVTTSSRGSGTIEEITRKLNRTAWQRRACGIGPKGFRVYDWALLNSPGQGRQYMIRRSIETGELAYYHCWNPRGEGFSRLVQVAGARWPVEECFKAGKSEVAFDHYQVRLYGAWYRHITLSILAHTHLAVLAADAKKGNHDLWTTAAR
jgi:SRSO17 transposase